MRVEARRATVGVQRRGAGIELCARLADASQFGQLNTATAVFHNIPMASAWELMLSGS